MNKLWLPLMALSFSAFVAACGDEELGAGCTSSSDCEDGFLCHPYSGQCAPDCSSDGLVCSGTQTPLCRTADGDALENFCICDATNNSCGAGSFCNENTGLCETGTPEDPQEPISCVTGEVGGLCEDGQVCVGGNSCQAMCDNVMSCLGSGSICDPTTDSATFNTCRDPDEIAVCNLGCFETCSDRGDHRREEDGPIIYDLQISGDMGATANCPAPARADRFVLSVYSSAGFSDSVFTEALRRLNSGREANTFSEGPASNTHPTIESRGNNLYNVTFFLCNDPNAATIFSVFMRDTAGRDSNAICFAPSEMAR